MSGASAKQTDSVSGIYIRHKVKYQCARYRQRSAAFRRNQRKPQKRGGRREKHFGRGFTRMNTNASNRFYRGAEDPEISGHRMNFALQIYV
jgi:hypothetical protein